MYFVLVSFILSVLCGAISVAFYTLMERKVLGFMQIRKGPNKIGLWGLLVPFADAIKLLAKESVWTISGNKVLMTGAPMLNLTLMFVAFMLYPSSFLVGPLVWIMMFFCLSSMSTYLIMLCGWSTNSIYGMLGAVRASAQSISYEVCFYFILFFPFFLCFCLSPQKGSFSVVFLFLPVFILVLAIILAETNRAPFDFAEGESELVSGFNVEYSSVMFVMLFLAEYGWMLLLSWFASHLLFSSSVISGMVALLYALMILAARGAYPRFRYDMLMGLCWGVLLPASMALFSLICL